LLFIFLITYSYETNFLNSFQLTGSFHS